jgi:broad specificity phosphatase PhoE
MSAMRLYFVRHGESEANRTRTFANWTTGHPLTETGVAQAKALAERLETEGVTHPYSSPVLRARQTSAILSERLRCPVQVTHSLREFDVGRFEGTNDPEGWREYGEVVEAWARGDSHRRIDQGESLDDIRLRFAPFVFELVERSQPEDRAVFVSHGGIYRAMLPLVLVNVAVGFATEHVLENTACVVGEVVDGALVCREWCGRPGPFA